MPGSGDILTDWKRWTQRTIVKAADQLFGAERWIRQFPSRIYRDRQCHRPLPVAIPSETGTRFHRIIVANGARERCREYFGGGTGSLIIEGGKSHDSTAFLYGAFPFVVGPPISKKGFIHVLDEYSLNVVLCELDTVTDFINYLEKKRQFFESKNHVVAPGEEELVAFYLRHYNDSEGYSFPFPDDVANVFIEEGYWQELQSRPEYKAKKNADRISYLWDSIINEFTGYLLKTGGKKIIEYEMVLRIMARERRLNRRMLSRALHEIVEMPLTGYWNARRVISDVNSVGYVFVSMTADRRGRSEDEFRRIRREVLYSYCVILADEQPQLHEVVGIATEQGAGFESRSYDLGYLDVREDRNNIVKQAQCIRESVGIGRWDYITDYHDSDFPSVEAKENAPSKQKVNKEYKKRRRRSR
jgi:hypothetical protein